MGTHITDGPSDTTIIDITPDPFPWKKFIIVLLALFALTALLVFLLVTFLPHSGNGHGSFGGIGGLVAIPAIIASQNRVKKITLSSDAIEIIRASPKLSQTIPLSQIALCTVKKSWGGGGWYKFRLKDDKKITLAAPAALFSLLKIELQKRYNFPIT